MRGWVVACTRKVVRHRALARRRDVTEVMRHRWRSDVERGGTSERGHWRGLVARPFLHASPTKPRDYHAATSRCGQNLIKCVESDVTDGKLVLTPTIKFLTLRDEYLTTADILLSCCSTVQDINCCSFKMKMGIFLLTKPNGTRAPCRNNLYFFLNRFLRAQQILAVRMQ